jgi:site-specific DNA recombinase
MDDAAEEMPYEYIKTILDNISKVLSESTNREQQKKLLHMMISEITIGEPREIDSIKLKHNDAWSTI